MATDGIERRLAAILSADVAGYSRLMAEDQEDLSAGRIPFSLIRWEMTGQTDEMEWLLSEDGSGGGS